MSGSKVGGLIFALIASLGWVTGCGGDVLDPLEHNYCTADSDCAALDDGNPCTDTLCREGLCSVVPNTKECSDGDPCTSGDACDGAGTCKGLWDDRCNPPPAGACNNDSECDDSNLCTNDTCVDGHCHYLNNHDPCDDGDLCTHTDLCGAGVCVGSPTSCVSDDCTARACDGTASCTLTPLGTPVYQCCAADDTCSYDYDGGPGCEVMYRTIGSDRILYLLENGLPDKMQSLSQNEADTCDWCGCAADCAYGYTGASVAISTSQDHEGLMALYRWVRPGGPGPFAHRTAVANPGTGWAEDFFLGYACPPGDQ